MCKNKKGKNGTKSKSSGKMLADDFFQIIDGLKTWDEGTDSLVATHFKKNPLATAMMVLGLKRTKKVEDKIKSLFLKIKNEKPNLIDYLPEIK